MKTIISNLLKPQHYSETIFQRAVSHMFDFSTKNRLNYSLLL
jgi:hypothetical protein